MQEKIFANGTEFPICSEHKFTISGYYSGKTHCFPSLNDYLREVGRNPKGGGRYKNQYKNIAIVSFRRELRGFKATKPVIIKYRYGEPKKGNKRDLSNIVSLSMKFIEDALQDCGCLKGDDPRYVKGFIHEFTYTDEKPFIEVTIYEIGE